MGFLPVFSMALHNWYLAMCLCLFSANAGDANLLVMPPSAYWEPLAAIARPGFQRVRARAQPDRELAERAGGSYWTIPLNAAGVAILIYVVLRGRAFDPWLRLIGAAALAQHAVALFYRADVARYHFLTWFLTMLVVMVFVREVGIGWLQRRSPGLSERLANHPLSLWLASGLARLQKSSA